MLGSGACRRERIAIDFNQKMLDQLAPRTVRSSLIQVARVEDLGDGCDVTSEASVPPKQRVKVQINARVPGVICGLSLLEEILAGFGMEAEAELAAVDGDKINAGAVVATLEGRRTELLTVERTMLNLLGHLSGIATATRRLVDLVAGTRAAICEQKTLPGLRGLQKYAVHCGGGRLHRFGLFDAALFKDNHLATMRSLGTDLEAACRAARTKGQIRFVEVEVDTLDQLDTVLSFEPGVVDIILLDNMPPEMMAEAVQRRDDRRPGVELEASGGISEATIQAVAQAGVDRISVGALTHSVQNLDLGFDL